MELGLAHSLSRYKLKFSPDKIDTMIVQVPTVGYNHFKKSLLYCHLNDILKSTKEMVAH